MRKAVLNGAIAVVAGLVVYAITDAADVRNGVAKWTLVIGAIGIAAVVVWRVGRSGSSGSSGSNDKAPSGVSILRDARVGDVEVDDIDAGPGGPDVSILDGARAKRVARVKNVRVGKKPQQP